VTPTVGLAAFDVGVPTRLAAHRGDNVRRGIRMGPVDPGGGHTVALRSRSHAATRSVSS
jgi:hypothetical protein